MSGETEQAVSGWTVDTLKYHFEKLLGETDRRYEQRFDGQEKAVEKAENAAEKRLDAVNEFRGQLSDQAATFLPRSEYDRAHADLAGRVDELNRTATEKLEAAVKALEARIAGLQAQVSDMKGTLQ